MHALLDALEGDPARRTRRIVALVVVALAIGVFVPLKYLYPSKMPRLGKIAMAGLGIVWVIGATVAVASRATTATWHLAEITLAYPALYVALSFWIGGLHRKAS